MDKQKYTAKDILELAIQAKARGIELYMILARNSENYHVSQLFVELAKDEQRHKLELQKWSEAMGADTEEEAYPREKAMFIRALADNNTFNCSETQKRVLETTINEEEALKAGINFEKDFMLFLHELKRNVIDGGTNIIDQLLDEEARHIRNMFDIRDKI